MKSFDAIIFDLDGTLYFEGPMRLRMIGELLRGTLRQGFKLPRALRAYRQEREALRGMPFPSGLALLEEHYSRASERSGVDSSELKKLVEDWMEKRPLRHMAACARPDLLSTLAVLDRHHIPVGVFSDHRVEGKLDALGVKHLVKAYCCATSAEVGAFKPDPKGFLSLADALGVPASRILVVGDRDDADGDGARNAGMGFRLLGTQEGCLSHLVDVLPLVGLPS